MTAPQPRRKHPGRARVWLACLAASALLGFATPLAILLGVLLAPSIAAAILDRSPGRGTARVTLVFGLAASARPVYRVLSVSADWSIATDPVDTATLAMAWAGQGIGAMLIETTPVFIRAALDAKARLHAEELRAARRALEAEWGIAGPEQGPVNPA